mgnify:FL=1
MRISVLMSVYEKEKAEYLLEALNSIKNQSVKVDEFIIVKDGLLTLELDDVLSEFKENCKDLKIVIVQLKINIGLGLALNEGLKFCNYEWIMRMDSDDISRINRVEIMKRGVLNDNFKHDVYGSHYEEFFDNSKNRQTRKVKLLHDDILLELRKKNPMNHVTILANKQCIIDSGGYKDFKSFEDYFLWARMLKRGFKFMNIDATTVEVRIGELMFKKRRGWFYFKQEFQMQKYLFESKLTSIFDFCVNCSIRCSVRLFPIFLIKIIYKISRK